MNRSAKWVACAVLLPGSAAAAAPMDRLVVSGQSAALSGPAPSGWLGSVDWLHGDASRKLFGVGLTHQRFPDARLSVGRLSGVFGVRPETSVSAVVEAGPVTEGLNEYTFTRQALEVSQQISPHLQVTGGGQQIASGAVRMVLARGGVRWMPRGTVAASLQLGGSVAGNLPTRFAMIRVDRLGRVQSYAGLVSGTGAALPIELGEPTYQSYTGGFIGVAVPLSRYLVNVSLDWTNGEAVVRRSATVTVNVPLRGGD